MSLTSAERDLGAAVNSAANAGASEISNSYGGTERHSYTSLNTSYFNHPGVVLAASSGDCNGNPTGWGVWSGTSVSSPIVAAEFGLAGGSA